MLNIRVALPPQGMMRTGAAAAEHEDEGGVDRVESWIAVG